MLGFINKIFGGSKSEKDVKKIQPLVKEINEHFASYQSLSNDELRAKTQSFRDRIAKHLADIDQQIAAKISIVLLLVFDSMSRRLVLPFPRPNQYQLMLPV